MRKLVLFCLLVSGLLPGYAAAADCMKGDAVFKTLKPQSVPFKDYEIRLYSQPDCEAEPESHIAGLQILKEGKQVYVQTGYSFALGYPLEQDQPPDSVKPALGMDFTGEGIPELLISEWSGGAHCCYSFHLFRLGETFSKIQSIPVLDADESAFVRRPGVKGLVLVTADYGAFAYFPSSFAGSPAGRVLLSFQDGRFRPDATLMKTTAPKSDETSKCAALFKPSRDWKGRDNDGQPLGMWYYATDLIYTGNETQAWAFLGAAWGGNAADKKKYLDEYRARLKKSVYYPELESLQKAPFSNADQRIDWTKQCFEYLQD
ncbi:MAG TPA: hypothetical protein VGH91_02805 [Gammaproteobacteria bacterium]|jgi:hypothetical protein